MPGIQRWTVFSPLKSWKKSLIIEFAWRILLNDAISSANRFLATVIYFFSPRGELWLEFGYVYFISVIFIRYWVSVAAKLVYLMAWGTCWDAEGLCKLTWVLSYRVSTPSVLHSQSPVKQWLQRVQCWLIFHRFAGVNVWTKSRNVNWGSWEMPVFRTNIATKLLAASKPHPPRCPECISTGATVVCICK